jgi:pilus assembly protein FimV
MPQAPVANLAGANAPATAAPEPGLSFDLDSPPAGTAAAPDELRFDLDFNTNSTETTAGAGSIDFSQTTSAAASDNAGHESPAAPSPGIDLDFSVLTTEPSATDESAVSGGIDFEASITSSEDVGLSFDADSPAPTGNGSNEIAWNLDSVPITPEGVAFESVGEIGEDNDIDNSQVDEAATKLDLAKAYIDMGDAEGARSILDEVLVEGNEKQKKQAAELAAQIT